MAYSATKSMNQSAGNHDSGQRIIQCPACQTKFAVALNAIESIESPRFHCSRCDHVFGIEEKEPVRVRSSNEEAKPVAATPPPAPKRAPISEPPPRMPEPEIEETPPPAHMESSWDVSNFEDPDPSAEETTILRNVPTPVSPSREPHVERAPTPTNRSLQIPRSLEPGFSSSAPFEGMDTDPSYGEPQAPSPKEPQLTLAFSAEREAASKLEEAEIPSSAPSIPPSSKTELGRETSAKLTRPHTPTVNIEAAQASLFANGSETDLGTAATVVTSMDQMRSAGISMPRGAWTHFALLFSPLILFLVALAGFSYVLKNSGAQENGVFSLILPPAPQAAPPGLHMLRTHMQNETLDSGNQIKIVSGTIVNRTSQAFKEMQIEVMAYTSNGDLIAHVRADARATLAKTKVKSLTLDMIRDIQSGNLLNNKAQRYELKPGDKLDFSLALTENDSNKLAAARYYSARIYSVLASPENGTH